MWHSGGKLWFYPHNMIHDHEMVVGVNMSYDFVCMVLLKMKMF